MHLKTKSKERGKGISKRVLSVVLSVLMLMSILYVGNVVTVDANAINEGKELYICFHKNDKLRWFAADDGSNKGNSDIAIELQDSNGISLEYDRLQYVNIVDDYALFRFTPSVSFSKIILHRWWGEDKYFSILDKATDYNDLVIRENSDITVSHGKTCILTPSDWDNSNCLYIKSNTGSANGNNEVNDASCGTGDKPDLGKTTSTIRGGNQYSAKIGYLNNGEYKVDDTYLYPVQAMFYDYLTDYELQNGWRCNDDYETSRTYLHRIPYIQWNSYISSLTGGEAGENGLGSNWQYPLYFGNFTTAWGDFSGYPYGTLVDKYIYNAGVTDPELHYNSGTPGHLRHEHQISNYTENTRLNNFSIFANDSEAIKSVNTDVAEEYKYSGSVQGLVKNTLSGNQLYMTTRSTDLVSPYFSFTDSNKKYINTVSTSFPMRINDGNNGGTFDGKSTTYTTYEFDSKGKTTGLSDNVYFSYNNGVPEKIYYSRDSGDEVTDAYTSLGGNDGGDHRGFFPFDNGGIGHDYGFGMRLDIPFNLTEDGNVVSVDSEGCYHKTEIPMMFDFEGDDDVWVFVDGNLALDLGGDHGNTKGQINFSLTHSTSDGVEKQSGAPLTGAFVLKDTPKYGETEYSGTGSAISLAGNFFSSDSYNSAGTKYKTTKLHTLTVFYMERGLVESNLRMSFSISPISNKLTVEKNVNTEDVNKQLRNSLGLNNESFKVKIDPYTMKGSKVVYKLNGSNDTIELPEDNTIVLKDNEYAEFENQFEVGEDVGVTEILTDSNKYTYTTSYTLTDEYQEEYEKPYTPNTGNSTAIPVFKFKTKSSESRAPTLYRAEFVNKIETAKVTVSKAYSGTAASSFTYGVVVTLPNGTDVTLSDITVDKNGLKEITGIPKGSTVKLTEKNSSDFTVKYKIGNSSEQNGNVATVSNIKADTTVAFTNSDIPNTPAEYTPKAKKYINGATAGSDKTFSFTITPWNITTNQGTGTAVTKNNVAGDITFDKLTFNSTGDFWYKIEEKPNTDYTIDTTAPYSNEYYLKCSVNLSNHVYTATHTYYKSDKTTPVTDENVIFNNIPVVTEGYLKIVKKGSIGEDYNFKGTQFTVYKVDDNKKLPDENSEKIVLTVQNGNTYNADTSGYETYVVSQKLDIGWYAVIETKAPTDYELSGECKWVQVTADNTENNPAKVEFVNTPSTDLPTTGGIGVVVFITIGVVLIGVAILLLRPKKEARK